MDQLTRTRQAAVLSAMHHNSEIVAPNGLFPLQYRIPSTKAIAGLLPVGQMPDAHRNAALQATARGALAAATRRVPAAREYRRRNLEQFLDAKLLTRFAPALSGGNLAALSAAKAAGVSEEDIVPPNAKLRIGPLPGADLISRDTMNQQPYLAMLASQVGLPEKQFPILLHTHDAWPDLDSFVTTVVIWLTISTKRFQHIDWLEHFDKYMDPANWARVNREFFGESRVSAREDFFEDGVRGWRGTLDEKVEWGMNDSFSSRIYNRLNIKYGLDKNRQELRVDYTLGESVTSEVGGSLENGGLDVDRGGVRMWRSDDNNFFYVIATKQLRFVNRNAPPLPGGVYVGEFLNFLAPASVGMWMDALVFQTALAAIDHKVKQVKLALAAAAAKKAAAALVAPKAAPAVVAKKAHANGVKKKGAEKAKPVGSRRHRAAEIGLSRPSAYALVRRRPGKAKRRKKRKAR